MSTNNLTDYLNAPPSSQNLPNLIQSTASIISTDTLIDIFKSPLKEPDFLDMLSADMDFEQAYSMYTTLQPEQAISSVQQLEKVQQLNQQYLTTLQQQHLKQQESEKPMFNQQRQFSHFPGNTNFTFNLGRGDASAYSYDRAQIFASSATVDNTLPNANNQNHDMSMMNMAAAAAPAYSFEPVAQSGSPTTSPKVQEDDDFDKFFSNTESNALELFLDNLANTTNSNPLQIYNNNNYQNNSSNTVNNTANAGTNAQSPGSEFHNMFDLYTMKTFPDMTQNNLKARQFRAESKKANSISALPNIEHESLKKELTEAFSHPHLKSIQNGGLQQNQLPTPNESRESSSFTNHGLSPDNKRDLDLSMDEDEPIKKRRRSSTKPLLSLEQKRLNHSHSEQRRRQMCKLAYERCLRLIIDIDAFNRLPAETAEMQKKTKRARVNKDGLPNLSKHSALMRISNEIVLIKNSNEELKRALEAAGVNDHLSFERLRITDSI